MVIGESEKTEWKREMGNVEIEKFIVEFQGDHHYIKAPGIRSLT
jgi:hypothetical protein